MVKTSDYNIDGVDKSGQKGLSILQKDHMVVLTSTKASSVAGSLIQRNDATSDFFGVPDRSQIHNITGDKPWGPLMRQHVLWRVLYIQMLHLCDLCFW